MFARILAMIISGAILFTAAAPLASAKEAQTPEQARAKVREIGTGNPSSQHSRGRRLHQ